MKITKHQQNEKRMYTEWYWSGLMAVFGRFYKLKIESHSQWEIQQHAKNIGNIFGNGNILLRVKNKNKYGRVV